MLEEAYKKDNPYGGKFTASISGARKTFDDSGWTFTIKDTLPGGGFKGLNAIGSGRFNMQAIESEIMDYVLEAAGYSAEERQYIDAIQTASNEIKAKGVYDFVRGTIEYVNNQYLQAFQEKNGAKAGKAELQDLADTLNKQFKGTGLGTFSVSNGMVTFSNDSASKKDLDPYTVLKQAGGYSKIIRDLGITKGLGGTKAIQALRKNNFFKETAEGLEANTENGIVHSIVSQAFLRFYNGENDLYDPDNPYTNDSRTYGFREINALKRTAGLLSLSGEGAGLKAYINSLSAKTSPAEYTKQKEAGKLMQRIATNAELTLDDLKKTGGVILSASDLEDSQLDTEDAFDKNGNVTDDYIKNLIKAQNLRQEAFDNEENRKKYGWETVEDVPIFIDPERFFGRRGTGGKSAYAGRFIALPRFKTLEKREGEEKYSPTQSAIIANRLLLSAHRYSKEPANSELASLGLGANVAKNVAEYNQALLSKEGGAYLDANKAELPTALMALATATELDYAPLRDKAAVILSREDVAEQLHKIGNKDDVTELKNIYKELTDKELKENISKTQAVEKILDVLTVGNKSFTGKGLVSIMNRYPTLLGLGDLMGVETFVAAKGDENIGKGTFGVNPILWSILNGDWDGDKSQLNLLLRSVTPEIRSDIQKAAEIALKKRNLIAKMDATGDRIFSTTDRANKLTVDKNKLQEEFKEENQRKATFLKSIGKDYVGLFSNVREGISSVLLQTGNDISGGISPDNIVDKDVAIASEMMRAFAQVPEQTVISIKKKAKDLGKKNSDKEIRGMLDDFLTNYWGNASMWSTGKNFKKIIAKGQELGIFEGSKNEGSVFGKDFTADRAVAEAWTNTLEILSSGNYSNTKKNLLKKGNIFQLGWLGTEDQYNSLIKDIEKTNSFEEARPIIEKAIAERQLGITSNILENSFNILDDSLKEGHTISGKFDSQIRIGDMSDIVRNIYRGALEGVGSTNDWLSSAGARYSPEIYENLKRLGLVDPFSSYGKTTGETIKEVGSHFKDLDSYFATLQNAVQNGIYGAGPSKIAHTADGYYIQKGGAGAVSNYDLTDFIADLNKKASLIVGGKVDNIPKLLADTEDNADLFKAMRAQYMRTQYGTDVHAIAELLNTGTKEDSKKFQKTYSEIEARSRLLFGNTNYASNVLNLGKLAQLEVSKIGKAVGSEAALNGINPVTGQAMSMFIDQLAVDKNGNLHIIDYKTHGTGKLTAGDKLQPLIYKAQLAGLRNALSREGVTGAGIGSLYDEWKEGTLYNKNIKDIFDTYFRTKEYNEKTGNWDEITNTEAKGWLEILMGKKNKNVPLTDEQIITDLISLNSSTGKAEVVSHGGFSSVEKGLIYRAFQQDYGLNSEEALSLIGNLYSKVAGSESSVNLQAVEGLSADTQRQNLIAQYNEQVAKAEEARKAAKESADEANQIEKVYGKESEALKTVNEALTENIQKYHDATLAAKNLAEAIDTLSRDADKTYKQDYEDHITKAERDAQKEKLEKDEKDLKESYQGFRENLSAYQQYQKNQWALEARYKKTKGTQKGLVGAEMELNQSYLEEAKNNLIGYSSRLTGSTKERAAEDIAKAEKALALQKAHIDASQKANSVWGQIGNSIKSAFYRMTVFSAGYKLVNKVAQSFKQVVDYAKQLDKVMVNIQIVTNTTREEAVKLMKTYADLGKQLGATVAEVAQSANVWLRQGYSINQVNELIKSSMYLSKLGMIDSAAAAKDLTSIIKAFKLEVSDATDVVSKLTMLDQSAAVSAGEVATAMQSLSTTAQQAGLDIDTTMAYVSTIADVTQKEASTIGASLRTIISRYGNVKAGAFSNMGSENVGEDLENINDIEKVLRRMGISIRTSTMEFRALDTVLEELAEKWETYSTVEKNAIATAMAGTRQRESLLVLLSNYSKSRELREISATSHGAAETKYNAYLDSYEASQKALQNAWQKFSLDLENSGVLTSINNLLAKVVEYLPQIVTTLGAQVLGMKMSNFLYSNSGSGIGKGILRGLNILNPFRGLKNEVDKDGTVIKKGLVRKGYDYVTGAPAQTISTKVTTINQTLRNIYTYLVTKKPTEGSAEGVTGEPKSAGKAAQQRPGIEIGKRAAVGATVGLAQGVTIGLSTGAGLKNSDGEDASQEAKIKAGLATGGATAASSVLLSLIPGVGPLLATTLGPIAGQLFGQFVAPLIGNFIDQEKISRRERSKEAERSYNAIKAIQSDTNALKELSTEGALSYDQYQKAKTSINSIITQLYGNTQAGRLLLKQYNPNMDIESLSDVEVIDRIKLLFNDYLLGDEDVRKEVINDWEQAVYQAEADTFRRSKENELYENEKTLQTNYVKHAYGSGVKSIIDDFIRANPEGFEENARRNNKLYFSGTASERLNTERQLLEYLEEQGKQGSEFYKNLQKHIADLNNAVHNIDNSVFDINEKQVKASAVTQGIGNLTTAQIKELGIDEIAKMILENINKQGGFYEENGKIQRQYQWTGSLNTLSKIPKGYISDYIKNNATLYGVLTGQSYTLGEVSRGALTGQKAEEYMVSFAKQLNIPLEELNANLEKYSSFSLGDIMKGYGDVKTSLESLDSLFSSIVSSTGLTADNFEEILSKYPDLIGQVGDIGSLVGEIFNKTDVYIEQQKKNILEDLGNNEEFFKSWKSTLSEEMLELMKETALENVYSGSSFWDAYMTLTEEDKDKFSEIAESFKKQFNSVTANVTIDTTILDKYRSYLSKIYEMQIKNLQDQKVALEKVNTQREYENKLVQARIKLENAQNEKVQVYREGIGFVYEADQEAIQQAQEELDKLENEKLVDSLDMIITEMQSQKDWLDQFSDRQEFKNLEKAFGTESPFLKTLGTNETSGLWGSVNKLIEIYNKIYNFNSENFTDAGTDAWEKGKARANSSLMQNYSDYMAYSNIKEGFSKFFLGEINRAGLRQILEEESTKETNSDSVKTYAGNLIADLKENEYSSTSILKSASNTQSQALVALEKTGEYAANLKNKYKVSNWYTELFTDKNLDILMSQNSEVKGKKDYLKRLALEGIMSMIQERPNAQQSWYAASPLIQSYFQTQDGNYNVNYQALSKYLSDNFNNIHKNYSGTGPIGPGTTKYNIISQLLDDIFNYQGIISGKDNLSGSVADSYAAGSLYTQGGLSSISEFGPELYATPGLSGAALIPEGSKVLPTTATKGLWELGNFANEFIKPLRSLGGLGSSSSTVFGADESTNINTLNITLRADKDFDADKFIQQLKALQAISKNN
ncbi:MAG: phage tail tape measure protein [Methanobrevibacter sp.]|nr:phage tail tape measure protein [Methanobrevibacter sp.]